MATVTPLRRSPRFTKKLNINFIGDGGVGKTAFIHKMRTNEFKRQYFATVGCNVHQFNVRTNHGMVELNLYDYAGQEKYNGRALFKSDASIIMFDRTNRVSYKNLKHWQSKCAAEPILIVGNKSDCADIKVVTDTPYIAVSSKTMTLTDLLTPILRRLTGHDDLVIVE